MAGKTLGHYKIIEPLGAGGMGEVYRARDTKLERDVAVKVLFEREAKRVDARAHSSPSGLRRDEPCRNPL